MANDVGRVPDGTGLSQAEPSSSLGPTGFDPSRGLFWFDVVVPSGPGLNTLARYQEYGSYPGPEAAQQRFLEVAAPATAQGYYYLCAWGVGAFPEERLFGSATSSPRPATRRDSDGSPKGGDKGTLGSVHDSAGRKASPEGSTHE